MSIIISEKLVIDGRGGMATVKAMQRFFGSIQDGIISGQKRDLQAKYFPALEAVGFGSDGSVCIKNLQRWVGVSQDGIIGSATVKAWQKKISVPADGIFGVNSMKAWQKYLNEHDKATYTVYLGHACADYDKKAGDGSKKEVLKSAFKYSTSSTSPFNWTWVFRPTDPAKAEKAASMCEKAIANNNIGYVKSSKTAYGMSMPEMAKKVGYDLSKISVKCGLSCGDLICLCNHYAGLSTFYDGSGLGCAKKLKANSNFTCLSYKNGMALKRGDTIITAHTDGKNNHVAMIL